MRAGRLRPELAPPLLAGLAALGAVGEFRVSGTSMRPLLLPGDRLRVTTATPRDLRVGCVVIRPGATGLVAHRLVGWWRRRGEWHLLTKGDGSPRLDPPLPASGLVARAVARVREGDVRRLETPRERWRGRGRAAASLAVGLMMEAWDRARRMAGRAGGWPAG